jgi:Esterase-like activity of phytase
LSNPFSACAGRYNPGPQASIALPETLSAGRPVQLALRRSESEIRALTPLGGIRAAEKTLLLNLDVLGLPLDNVEGVAFRPAIRDGWRSLVLVSDNNSGRRS